MNEGLIPRRYAKALYKFALEKGQDKPMYGLMQSLVGAFASNASLYEVMANPFIADDDKVKLLHTASGAGEAQSCFDDFLKFKKFFKNNIFITTLYFGYIEKILGKSVKTVTLFCNYSHVITCLFR